VRDDLLASEEGGGVGVAKVLGASRGDDTGAVVTRGMSDPVLVPPPDGESSAAVGTIGFSGMGMVIAPTVLLRGIDSAPVLPGMRPILPSNNDDAAAGGMVSSATL